MTSHFIPRKSSAHRIACKALYRALLEQCPRIPLPPELTSRGPINPIQHLIRKKFRQNIYLSSSRLVVKGLKAGYAVEQLLRHAGDGHAVALSQIHTLLRLQQEESAHAHAITPKPILRPRPIRPAPYPGAGKVLEIRPLPTEKLTGRRRVPHIRIIHAGRTPFLLFKKKQSPYLTRVLGQLHETRFKRLTFLQDSVEKSELSNAEARWERHVQIELEKEGLDVEAVRKGDSGWGKTKSWTKDVNLAIDSTRKAMDNEYRERVKMTKRMIEIRAAEEKLAQEERKARKIRKDKERRERREQRRAREEQAGKDD